MKSFVICSAFFIGNDIAYSEHDVCIDELEEYKQLPYMGTLVIIATNEKKKTLRYLEKIPYQNNTAQIIPAKTKFLV